MNEQQADQMQSFLIDDQENWHIRSQDFHCDCVISPAQRQSLLDGAKALFTHWLLDGKTYDLKEDPFSDRFALDAVKRDLREEEKVEILGKTLERWMEERTGEWKPTSVGKYHTTYEDRIRDYLSEELWEILELQIPSGLSDDDLDIMTDGDEWVEARYDVEESLFHQIAEISASEAFQQFELAIQQHQILQETQQILRIEYHKQANAFFDTHIRSQFPAQGKDSFQLEKPLWRECHGAEKLQQALRCARPEDLQAIKAVGLKIIASNTVQREIDQIVKNFFQEGDV